MTLNRRRNYSKIYYFFKRKVPSLEDIKRYSWYAQNKNSIDLLDTPHVEYIYEKGKQNASSKVSKYRVTQPANYIHITYFKFL